MREKNEARVFSDLSHRVIGLAIEVHRELGPGLPESSYRRCLEHELHAHGIVYVSEHPVPVIYKGQRIECGYRADLLVENQLLLGLKSVSSLAGLHTAQLLTYMRLAEVRHGLLISFSVAMLRDGTRSFVL